MVEGRGDMDVEIGEQRQQEETKGVQGAIEKFYQKLTNANDITWITSSALIKF